MAKNQCSRSPNPEIESALALAKFYLFEASCLASAAVVSAEIDNAERFRQ